MANKNRILIDTNFAIKQEALNKYESLVNKINKEIENNDVVGHQFLGSFAVRKNYQKENFEEIKNLPKLLLSENIDTLVIIASQHICLQSQALIDLVRGKYPENNNKNLNVIFVDETINGRDIAQLIRYLESKNFAINVISQTGETIETLLIFRELKLLLQKAVGIVNASNYIYVTTNNNYGKLFKEVQLNKYKHFVLLDNSTEKFFSFSPAILVPLACAGIDIEAYVNGAAEANEYYKNAPLKDNSAYIYALSRFILEKNNFKIENINYYSNAENKLASLFRMYLTEACLRKTHGILVSTNRQSADLCTYSESLINAPFKCFETSIICDNPKFDYSISLSQDNDDDYYNYLSKLTYNTIGKTINRTITENHVINYKIPNLKIIIENYEETTLGWIVVFIQRAAVMCAYLQNINPFDNVGTRSYSIELMKNITELTGGSKND
ncbi:glucose-6-phosphate isomerase [Metamycoplasma neophronis]|uniref:Glucose-6-phosphate isomerase n=1 Tax=Metamycoplasma neophronis TaxID=872983 RepID=A0ABY2Z0W1_9BACT|nr:glucose-6-phosphate isomerase [Metamycoplasma neophronis]TPR54685.1 glucose-6-phosphate isomerase [Metamycoplasma neophronis]